MAQAAYDVISAARHVGDAAHDRKVAAPLGLAPIVPMSTTDDNYDEKLSLPSSEQQRWLLTTRDGPRTMHDLPFAVFFAFNAFITLVLGMFGFFQIIRNTTDVNGTNLRIEWLKSCGWLLLLGSGLSILWGMMLKYHSKNIIKAIIFFSIASAIAFGIINIFVGNIIGAVILFIAALCKFFWYCIVRKQIEFATNLLACSIDILNQFPGVGLLWGGTWIVISWLCVSLLVSLNFLAEIQGVGWKVNVILIIMFWWCVDFVKNWMYTVICGIVVRWYANGLEAAKRENTLMQSLKRPLTNNIGSIALGSFILLVIKIPKYFLRKGRSASSIFAKMCCLFWTEPCSKYLDPYNNYAFAYMACHGDDNFVKTARTSVSIVEASRLESILYNSILEDVVTMGSLIISACLGCAGFYLSFVYDIDGFWNVLAMISLGVVIGISVSGLMTVMIYAALSALFFCIALQPYDLPRRQPALHSLLVSLYSTNSQPMPSWLLNNQSAA